MPVALLRWSRLRPTETTLSGTEVFLLRSFLLIRALDVLQLLVSLPSILSLTSHPVLGAVTILSVLLESGWLARTIWRAGALRSTFVVWVDVVTISVATLITGWLTPASDQLSTWAHWGYPFGLCAAGGAGIALQSWKARAAATATLSVTYLFSVASVIDQDAAHASTGAVNAVGYPAFLIALAILSTYLRRLGAAADAARHSEAAALRSEGEALLKAERIAAGSVIHDHIALLRKLGLEAATSELRQAVNVTVRAAERAYLGAPISPTAFVQALSEETDKYPDLPLTQVGFSSESPDPDPVVIRAVCQAVGTSLANVREHANAAIVTVRYAHDAAGWQLSILDDGCGFDPDKVVTQFGTEHLLLPVRDLGVTVDIDSAPGEGTLVSLAGRW